MELWGWNIITQNADIILVPMFLLENLYKTLITLKSKYHFLAYTSFFEQTSSLLNFGQLSDQWAKFIFTEHPPLNFVLLIKKKFPKIINKFSNFEEFSQLLCTVTNFLYFRFLAVLQILVEGKWAKFESSQTAKKWSLNKYFLSDIRF